MDKNNKKYLMLSSSILASVALGLYTQNIEWAPAIRTMAHFFGAVAVPGVASLVTSNLINEYQERKNKKIEKLNLNKEKDKDKDKDKENIPYSINPKLKENLLKASMIIGSIGYIAFCVSWESWQFAQSNVFQLPQYMADISGPLVGMSTIGTIDGKPLLEKINRLEDKILKRFRKVKEENTIEEPQQNKEKEVKIDQENELPPWDLRLYEPNNKIAQVIKENDSSKEIEQEEDFLTK